MIKRIAAAAMAFIFVIAMLAACSADPEPATETSSDPDGMPGASALIGETASNLYGEAASRTNNSGNNGGGSENEDADDEGEGRERNLISLLVQPVVANGFLDALRHMDREDNISSEISLTFSFADDTEFMSLTQFINTAAMGDESFLFDTKVGLSIAAETYEDAERFTLGWIGSGGIVEPLITIIFVDGVFYLSVEILDYIGEIEGLEDFASILPIFNFDYIAINFDELLELLEANAGMDMGIDMGMDMASIMDDITALEEAMQSAADALAEPLHEYAVQIMTSDILTQDGDTYTLTLDAEAGLRLIGVTLDFMAQNEPLIKDTLNILMSELAGYMEDMDIRELTEALDYINFAELAEEFDEGLASITADDLPDITLVIEATGTGRGLDKQQMINLALAVKEIDDPSLPFDMMTLEISYESAVTQAPIAAPPGTVITIEELLTALEDIIMELYMAAY